MISPRTNFPPSRALPSPVASCNGLRIQLHKVAAASTRGFTLVEILAVMSVVALLAAAAVPAVNSLSSSNRLGGGARLVSNLLNTARSEAINQRTYVQLRIVTTLWTHSNLDDPTGHYRKMSLWKFDPNSTDADPYVQFSAWETLPEGILFDNTPDPSANDSGPPSDTGTYFLEPNQNLNNSAENIVSGSTTANVAWIEFKPTGAVNAPASVNEIYLHLAPGFLSGSDITHTDAMLTNWMQIRISTLTGRIRVLQPE